MSALTARRQIFNLELNIQLNYLLRVMVNIFGEFYTKNYSSQMFLLKTTLRRGKKKNMPRRNGEERKC